MPAVFRRAGRWIGKLKQKIEKLLLTAGRFRDGAELGEDFVFFQDHVFLVVNLDVIAAVLAEQNAIADFHVERDAFALLALSGADSYDFTLLRFLFCGVWDDDAAL